ncbi:MAG: hypothetical protein Q4A15_11380, partial [Prevotellaceae bacterium]|nr:hypothetical protein [Prevotellaceae bacterium]
HPAKSYVRSILTSVLVNIRVSAYQKMEEKLTLGLPPLNILNVILVTGRVEKLFPITKGGTQIMNAYDRDAIKCAKALLALAKLAPKIIFKR